MPNIPSNPLVRGIARGGAGLLRAGAGLLDAVAGSTAEQDVEARENRQADQRPAAVPKRPSARHTPAQARESAGRRSRPRTERQRSTAPKDLDDVTIARKVETELFRDPNVPKGHISVNVADGIVFLRGEVKHPDDVNRLAEHANAIPEVQRVENLLHLPKTPAPTRADTPAKQQKPAGRRTRPHSAEVHITDNVNAEVPVPGAEPGPEELARQRKGRQPAKLGSRGAARGQSDDAPEATPPSQRSVDSVNKDPEPAKRA